MCVCIHMYEGVLYEGLMCRCVCVNVCEQSLMPGVFLGLSLPSVLKKNLSLAQGVPTWLVPHCSWNPVLLPPRCWDYRQPLYLPDIHMGSGDPNSGP